MQVLIHFGERWQKIRPTVRNLLQQKSVTRSEWMQLIESVNSICLLNDTGVTDLYEALQEEILNVICDVESRLRLHQDEVVQLKAYVKEWKTFYDQCFYFPIPFGQLEALMSGKSSYSSMKTYQREDSIICKLMVDTWSQSLFLKINSRLLGSVMKLVDGERNGVASDMRLVIDLRQCCVNLSSQCEDKLKMYRQHFEKPYLEALEDYYKAKATEYLATNGTQKYMIYVDTRLKEEEHRAVKYMESSHDRKSVKLVVDCCVKLLITTFEDVILAECQSMIKNSEMEQLRLMYRLMDQVEGGIDKLLGCFEQHLKEQDLVSVEQLLEHFSFSNDLVKNAFFNNPRFVTSLDMAFTTLVNRCSIVTVEMPAATLRVEKVVQDISCATETPEKESSESTAAAQVSSATVTRTKSGLANKAEDSKCPELLAKYADALLNKTSLRRRLTSEEAEQKLRGMVLVSRYLQNKDVFARFYKAHLKRRLILDSSADLDVERNMVAWLRDVCLPAEYCIKMSRMLQDITVSKNLDRLFKDECHHRSKNVNGLVSMKFLNAATWMGNTKETRVRLPAGLEDSYSQMETFMQHRNTGRKLQWDHSLSNGIISFASDHGKYDLMVNTSQMAILFAWNQCEQINITFESLKLFTALSESELRKTLFSMVLLPKVNLRVLLCDPEVKTAKDFTDSTLLWVNRGFCLIKNGKVLRTGRINLIGGNVVTQTSSSASGGLGPTVVD